MAPVGLPRWQESLLVAELGRGAVSPGVQGWGGALAVREGGGRAFPRARLLRLQGHAPGPRAESGQSRPRPTARARRGEQRVWAEAGPAGTPPRRSPSPLHLPAGGEAAPLLTSGPRAPPCACGGCGPRHRGGARPEGLERRPRVVTAPAAPRRPAASRSGCVLGHLQDGDEVLADTCARSGLVRGVRRALRSEGLVRLFSGSWPWD